MDCNNKFNAYIFDFDGVIADTERLHYKAWNKGFEAFGGSLTWAEYLPLKSTGRNHIVETFAEKLRIKISDEDALKLCEIKDKHFQRLCSVADRSLITNGAEAFLQRLRAKKAKIAVASSAATTSSLLKRLGLEAYFDAVVDGNYKLAKKPEPAVFLEAARLLNASSEECLVFEDSVAGVKAAENAGMRFVAVGGLINQKAILNIEDFSSERVSELI